MCHALIVLPSYGALRVQMACLQISAASQTVCIKATHRVLEFFEMLQFHVQLGIGSLVIQRCQPVVQRQALQQLLAVLVVGGVDLYNYGVVVLGFLIVCVGVGD